MIKTIKRTLMSFSVLAMLLVPALVPAAASAQTDDTSIQKSLKCGSAVDTTNLTTGDPTDCTQVDTDAEGTVEGIVKLVINVFSWVVGIISVIMIIIGGLKYITSGGDSGNVGSAKNTILYAVVGLVVVALAQVLVQFVLEKVTS